MTQIDESNNDTARRNVNVNAQSKGKDLIASTIGNVLEWYEWSAYAVFAPFIAAAMFNSEDPISGLLSTLGVFAIGFLMRPLGGVIFGWVADRRGRKFVLVTTMLMMAGGSLAMAVMPTYENAGIWASFLLLVVRVVQGFAHGGETATAYTYVAEIAPRRRRGLWGSAVFIAIFGGSVLAYGVAGSVTSIMPDESVAAWGWRIPFVLGALLALAALYMRRNMGESEVFHEQKVVTEKTAPLPKAQVTRAIVLMIAMTSGVTAAHYTWTSYASTYAITQKGMDSSTAFWMTLAAQLIALATLPLWGWISDRVGRRPMMLIFAVLMIVLSFPLTNLIGSDGWTLLLASAIALVIVAIPGALLSAILSENFPTKIRTRAIGFAYSISVAVFGGTAPYLNALLNSQDVGWLSSVYIIVLCMCTGIACFIMKETKGIDLKDA
jgi:MHS family alpha-ketoglutarate permease-like MFS transporter